MDMQPITPPVGGGRLRLMGVFGHPPSSYNVTYLGTYDWPGERKLDLRHNEYFRELLIPLSPAHHDLSVSLKMQHGVNVIDLLFHKMVHLSSDFVNQLTTLCRLADVLVFSHPWLYPVAKRLGLLEGKLTVYDAHNVEGLLRDRLLPHSPYGRSVVAEVYEVERLAAQETNILTCCSREDADIFRSLYGISANKIFIIENGASYLPAESLPSSAHSCLRAVFIGSEYGPNNEAARLIVDSCAPSFPNIRFSIAGSVCNYLRHEFSSVPSNVDLHGVIDSRHRASIFEASGFALNPVPTGSGTNIKMYDYLFYGLPIVSSVAGARGIDRDLLQASEIVPVSETRAAIQATVASLRGRRATASRLAQIARNRYDWKHISHKFYNVISSRLATTPASVAPFFSVVVPTFERREQLGDLLAGLNVQSFRNFEVIVIDQSLERSTPPRDYSFPLSYHYVPFKGAVLARNHGGSLARGEYIAFIDDDCIPEADWLDTAANILKAGEYVGIEGEIQSEFLHHEGYRSVENSTVVRGFMTANLFVRTDVFRSIGGFNNSFDHPHFREDTEFGIRAEKLGSFRRANNVRVFHPAHVRANGRESLAERNIFFRKDALLFEACPQEYERLFHEEAQWVHNPNYLRETLIGFVEFGITAPPFLLDQASEFLIECLLQKAQQSRPKRTHNSNASAD